MKDKHNETEYKNNSDYDLALEKFFYPDIYTNKQNGTLTKAFAISNEQLPDIFKPLDLTGKKVATVGASGDQALNAILQGCRDFTIIDGNSYAEPLIEYKIALIKSFDFKTFNKLFLSENMFNWKIYAKISHHLSLRAKQFWDTIMLELSEGTELNEPSTKRIPKKMFIFNHNDKHSNFYNDEATYNKLQIILNNNDIHFNYIDAELKDFPIILESKYHLIFLSNIYFYYQKNIDEFKQIIDQLYTHSLADGGKMIINYEFDTQLSASPITFGEYALEIQEVTRKTKDKTISDTVWIINKPQTMVKENNNEYCK